MSEPSHDHSRFVAMAANSLRLVLCVGALATSARRHAQRLVVTPKTVRNHVEHIYAKIDASSRAAAALFAMRHGLLPGE